MQASLLELRAIEFFVPGDPVPQGSLVPFFHKGLGRAALKAGNEPELKAWRDLVRVYARRAWASKEPSKAPFAIRAMFGLPRVRLISGPVIGVRQQRFKAPLPTVKPDLDKLVRAIGDAMTGVVFVDDSQIVRVHAEKEWANQPGVRIRLEELPSE